MKGLPSGPREKVREREQRWGRPARAGPLDGRGAGRGGRCEPGPWTGGASTFVARSPHSDAFLQQKPWQPVSPHFTEDARPWGFAQSQSENLTGPGDSRVPARALPTTLPPHPPIPWEMSVVFVLKE